MRNKILTERELYLLFEAEINRLGSQKDLAEQMGVSTAYVSDLHHKNRQIGCPAVLKYFGLEHGYTPKDKRCLDDQN